MNGDGNMYVPPGMLERLLSGKEPDGIEEATPEKVAEVVAQPGSVELTEDQARLLANHNRAFRRVVAAEMAHGRSFNDAFTVAREKLR